MEVGKLLFLLDVDQIRQLAHSIYLQEVKIIKSVVVDSEPDLARNLADSRSNYDSILRLLDNGLELKRKYSSYGGSTGDGDDQTTPTKLSVATDIYTYSVYSINYALQAVNNYSLRLKYLEGISANVDELTSDLYELHHTPEKVNYNKAENDSLLEKVAKAAAHFVIYSLKFAKKHQSELSQLFSQKIRESGMSIRALVDQFTERLGFAGSFEYLTNLERFQVYEAILEASGLGAVVEKWFLRSLKAAGIAALLISAGLLVWDVYTSDHKLLTLARGVVVEVAECGGLYLGDLIGTTLATAALAEAGVSAGLVLMAGFLGGIAGVFIVGAFVGSLFHKMIESGGKNITHESTGEHLSYVADMPDGAGTARQIAHHHKQN